MCVCVCNAYNTYTRFSSFFFSSLDMTTNQQQQQIRRWNKKRKAADHNTLSEKWKKRSVIADAALGFHSHIPSSSSFPSVVAFEKNIRHCVITGCLSALCLLLDKTYKPLRHYHNTEKLQLELEYATSVITETESIGRRFVHYCYAWMVHTHLSPTVASSMFIENTERIDFLCMLYQHFLLRGLIENRDDSNDAMMRHLVLFTRRLVSL